MNLSAELAALAPPADVTVTSIVPVPAGDVAVILVLLLTVTEVAALLPKRTAVAPVKLRPVIVTVVPPNGEPLLGEIAVIAGCGIYVNRSAALVALVPPTAVTVTSTVPLPGGDPATILLALATLRTLRYLPPKLTAVAPEKWCR